MINQKIDRSPGGVANRNGLSRGFIYTEIRKGNLKARKVGSRTVITAADEAAWQESWADVTVDEYGRLISGEAK